MADIYFKRPNDIIKYDKARHEGSLKLFNRKYKRCDENGKLLGETTAKKITAKKTTTKK